MTSHSKDQIGAEGRGGNGGKGGKGGTAVRVGGGKGGKYLTFRCGGESFAVTVAKVREIIGVQEITAVPKTAAYVKGVLNLRGRVIPVIDLRRRLGFEERAYDARTCIVVLQPEGGGGSYYAGIVVDTVTEVVAILEDDIQRGDDVTLGLIRSPFVAGVARVCDRIKILLNLELVLSREDVDAVAGPGMAEGQLQDVA